MPLRNGNINSEHQMNEDGRGKSNQVGLEKDGENELVKFGGSLRLIACKYKQKPLTKSFLQRT